MLDSDDKWLKEGIKAKPNVIKPNVHEAEEWLETELRDETSIVKALKDSSQAGHRSCAISRGAEGLIVATKKES